MALAIGATRRVRVNPLVATTALIILLEVLVAVAAPLISSYVTGYDPSAQDMSATLSPPTPQHWFGTDELGRDTLTRMVWGTRVSLALAFLTVCVSITFGMLFGATAGLWGGWFDMLLMRVVDALLAIPPIFFFILLSSLLRPGVVGLALIIGSISWVSVARLVRGEVLATRQLDFVLAARAVGVSDVRLLRYHVLPAAVPVLLVTASLAVAQVILAEAALSFLGLGIIPPTPSWGNMITAAQTYLTRGVYLAVFPGSAIFITVLCVSVLGNALRDALDTRLN